MLDIYLPFCDIDFPLYLLFGLGAVVGLLGGFFGVGGGWIVTPALNIFGLPMTYAVGTGFGYMMGMSFISAMSHRRGGNLDFRLGATIGVSMMAGVYTGKRLMMLLAAQGNADPVVRMLYICLLLGLGFFMLYDSFRSMKRFSAGKDAHQTAARKTPLLQRFDMSPKITFTVSDVQLSLWPLVVAGLIVGLLSGVLGVGGGFMLMPIMVYLAGVPTIVAVGTSLLCLVIASPFGVLSYSGVFSGISAFTGDFSWSAFSAAFLEANRVEYWASAIMIAGAVIGAPLGVSAGKLVKEKLLRLLYAVLILLGGTSVIFKQLEWNTASKTLILCSAGGMGCVVLVLALVAKLRAKNRKKEEVSTEQEA